MCGCIIHDFQSIPAYMTSSDVREMRHRATTSRAFTTGTILKNRPRKLCGTKTSESFFSTSII
jgi:hypothetical protein